MLIWCKALFITFQKASFLQIHGINMPKIAIIVRIYFHQPSKVLFSHCFSVHEYLSLFCIVRCEKADCDEVNGDLAFNFNRKMFYPSNFSTRLLNTLLWCSALRCD